jgi:glutamate 5-kinase
VVKIGSSLFYSEEGGLQLNYLSNILKQLGSLARSGGEIIIVSSGAIALGMNILNLKSRPKELPLLQAAAAVGQNALMDSYSAFFKAQKIKCAQVLLTWDDFDNRSRYLSAKDTLLMLLRLKCIPVINENDTISTDEIKFGDNDRLSALVATLINADLLIILSDVDGLLSEDKRLIKLVPEITRQIKGLASPTDKKTCVGGMVTKIEAARIAADSGIPCVIANGRSSKVILSITRAYLNTGNWTLFFPKQGFLAARQRWIAFGTKAKGKVIVDEGAKQALLNKKSLLSVGIVGLGGDFESGDIVALVDKQESEFARGKVNLSSKELEKVKGRRFDREVIHRDNIVIL